MKNFLERAVCTLMIFVAGISWAVVLGQVAGIMSHMDADEQGFRKIMDELNQMLIERSIPMPMRRRLRGFFLSNKACQSHIREKRILLAMSPGLQREMTMEMNRIWIGKVAFLNDVLRDAETSADGKYMKMFVLDISQELQFAAISQLEAFGMPHVLYILNRGIVVRKERLFQSGAVWGIDFVLCDARLLEPHECVALTYAEITSLTRVSFMTYVDKYKHKCPTLQVRVRTFCIWLATQRAILSEAWKRREVAKTVPPGRRTLANGGWLGCGSEH